MGTVEDFISWGKLKIFLHQKNRGGTNVVYFRERQIWWASIGQNIGVELNGKNKNFERPVVIIKKFNKDIFLVVPLSSVVHLTKYHLKIALKDGMVSYANISQIRVLSVKRLIRKIGEITSDDRQRICTCIYTQVL